MWLDSVTDEYTCQNKVNINKQKDEDVRGDQITTGCGGGGGIVWILF